MTQAARTDPRLIVGLDLPSVEAAEALTQRLDGVITLLHLHQIASG